MQKPPHFHQRVVRVIADEVSLQWEFRGFGNCWHIISANCDAVCSDPC